MTQSRMLDCPKCGQKTAVLHCDSASSDCAWLYCRACKSTVDPTTRRGFTVTGPFRLSS